MASAGNGKVKRYQQGDEQGNCNEVICTNPSAAHGELSISQFARDCLQGMGSTRIREVSPDEPTLAADTFITSMVEEATTTEGECELKRKLEEVEANADVNGGSGEDAKR
ncbi:hypothetical protein GUJ93_ZPchr0004g39723 [Zizania palustris]|uniref:Uncharacterized protein n=1 Tax=Zizania palustris TaxID=103762 RepID=A0A8J5S0U2_ZIZPA|nr:hypothetical protein GUJ93_ZPchr0004g39723 [Zizania palustris]